MFLTATFCLEDTVNGQRNKHCHIDPSNVWHRRASPQQGLPENAGENGENTKHPMMNNRSFH
jgi:hypothetical protein